MFTIKVSVKETYIKEKIIIDPYLPIKVRFGNFNPWEDITHYVRFGDFRYSMVEVGYSADSGIIHSVALVGAKDIVINKGEDFKADTLEDGMVAFFVEDFKDKFSSDVVSSVSVSTNGNEIVIRICDEEVVKFVKNGVVRFGVSANRELCCIVVSEFKDKDMSKLVWCLEDMRDFEFKEWGKEVNLGFKN